MKSSSADRKQKIEETMIPQTYEKKVATRNSLFRLFFVFVVVILQAFLFMGMVEVFKTRYTWFATGIRLLAVLLVLKIYSRDRTASVKMPWIILILLAPILGSLLYLIVGLSGSTFRMKRRYRDVDSKLEAFIPPRCEVIDTAESMDRGVANMMRYIQDRSGFPAYDDSDIEFFADAGEALAEQISEMKKAEHFIFLEYFAIEDKETFAPIKDVLAEKAAEGVDVRVFYDDMGSISFISKAFARNLRELGIKCKIFNPITMLVNFFLDNRDHRKIAVIDGRVAFTGGYNLANEYINITHPYGKWKDTGVKITGPAVRNFTMMCLEMWNAVRGDDVNDSDFAEFFPESDYKQSEQGAFIQPYGDSPLDNVDVGESVYMNVINNAQRYVWLTTPYLIITDEMNNALSLAAERGVDVRIITPGIPDKRTIYGVTKSYYRRLVCRGVKIYHYTPGFMHAKMCVSDDKVATCGTINLDYRSFYHHFEDSVLMYNCRAVSDIREDMERTLLECEDVSEKYRKGFGPIKTLWNETLRLFSALM